VVALNQSDVHIWYRSTMSLDDEAVKSADQHLSIEERTRRDRLRLGADRRDFTIAHDLLRRSLSKYVDIPPTEWRFATNEYGKPSIENIDPQVQALSFSLSHTRGCVACAITSNVPLGVDVERIDQSKHVQEVADRYFSEEEAAWLCKCSDDLRNIRFAELWTLKEAFLKAMGLGLSGPLTDVSFGFDEHARVEIFGPFIIDPREWHAALFEPVHNVRLGLVIRSVAQPHFFMRQDQGDGRTLDPIRVSASFMKNNILSQN
jgi:4'-phosphopantetheinyl transferase